MQKTKPRVAKNARELAKLRCVFLIAVTVLGCSKPVVVTGDAPFASVTISIVGTNDLHGHIERLAVFSGYLKNLRAAREVDGGGVVLVDAGDMFQGTLESNLGEGDVIVDAYNVLEYSAVAVGNHEFDFGPVGPAATPQKEGDDPRGALKARAASAKFPFLAANLVDQKSGERMNWPNMPASTTVNAVGIKVGIIGVTTEATLRTTIAANGVGLKILSLWQAIEREANVMRKDGVSIVVVSAHAGGRCQEFSRPSDLSSCDTSAEIFHLARSLSPKLVDVIVGGHTHAAIAHVVNGIAIIESYSYGRAFGRVDVTIKTNGTKVVRVFAPRNICESRKRPCAPGAYQGKPVAPDEALATVLSPAIARARKKKARQLGVELVTPIKRSYAEESALGNLFADLMRKAVPTSDLALTNGGGLRADLPAGALTYGHLYEAFPFDNQLATVKMSGAQFRDVLTRNLQNKTSIFSLSGVSVAATCERGTLVVVAARKNGKPIADDEQLSLITTDFLATGGDGVFGLALRPDAVQVHQGRLMRDEMARLLRRRGNKLDAGSLLSKSKPRWRYPARRPVRCR